MTRVALALILAALCAAPSAEARPRHHRHYVGHDYRPRAWCGAWMSQHVYGHSVRELWLARNWARVGRPAFGPAPGVIGVQPHHVFRVVSVAGPGKVLAISGNDGGRVRTRVRSTRNVIAWRMP